MHRGGIWNLFNVVGTDGRPHLQH